ncbi:MAG: ZIP family metal transporter [Gemmatimonadota bacterium]|nr:ZIP family metal transporter [Gemmatimonadota bacterium]
MSGLPPLVEVFLYGLVTALATGLGALPFAFVRKVSPRLLAHANAVASGLMLGASFGLLSEGADYGRLATLVGANAGVLFVLLAGRALGDREVEFGRVRGDDARRMVLIVLVMTVHSVAEGVAIGTAFAGGATLAVVITAAIAVHNVPEGLAITAVLRPRGTGLVACAGWSVFSSLPQPLLAVPAFLFVDTFRAALPYGLGFAAGAMVFMVLVELLPEAFEEGSRSTAALLVTVTTVAMVLFQQYL